MWEQHFRSIQNRIRAYCRPQRVTPSPRSPNVASTKPLSGELTTAGCGQYSTLTSASQPPGSAGREHRRRHRGIPGVVGVDVALRAHPGPVADALDVRRLRGAGPVRGGERPRDVGDFRLGRLGRLGDLGVEAAPTAASARSRGSGHAAGRSRSGAAASTPRRRRGCATALRDRLEVSRNPSWSTRSRVDGWTVSPRKSRKKSVCFSSTTTSIPLAPTEVRA